MRRVEAILKLKEAEKELEMKVYHIVGVNGYKDD